jgi:hypothetical protein
VLLNEGTRIFSSNPIFTIDAIPDLRAAFNEKVINVRIPFPSTGHQKKFQKAFIAALKPSGLEDMTAKS